MPLAVVHDAPLAPLTTLGLGGPARRLVRVTSVAELHEALALADGAGEPVLVLGGGSNLVVGDAGWPGLVVQLAIDDVRVQLHEDSAVVSAFAGVAWDAFVAQMVDAGLAGVECLSGIPGLVGATPIQNVGAYGQEVADTIVLVRALDRTSGEIVTLTPAACRFAYRSSAFKGSARWIVIEVRFRLARSTTGAPLRYPELSRALGLVDDARAPIAEIRRAVLALRGKKGMVVDPADPDSRSAGSFFMNPVVDDDALAAFTARLGPDVVVPRFAAPDGNTKLSAAWLIERAGFAKGYTVGRVGISTKHALALVNRGGATAAELLALAREIQDGVRERLGVELTPEPVLI